MHRHWLRGFALVPIVSIAAPAQAFRGVIDGFADLGGAVLQQPGLAATHVLTAGGQFRYATPELALATNGVAAMTPDDRFTGQGVFTASRFAPPTRRWRWELSGTASAFGLSNQAPAFAWQALAREHWTGSLGGLFIGGAYGKVTEGGVASEVSGAHAGGYLRFDSWGQDELSMALAYIDAQRAPETGNRFRYRDALAFWTHRARWLELSAGAGARGGDLGGGKVQSWASGSAVVWLAERTGLVFAGGRALADPARGVPSVRYLSISLRLGGNGPRGGPSLHVRREASDDGEGRLDVRSSDDSLRVVAVRLPRATTVELMGDFTDWEAVPMTKLPNGEWTLERWIAPGSHRVAIRIDGGGWTIPPNLPRVADDFGGEAGLVTVP